MTVLSSVVVQTLRKRFAKDNIPVQCLYLSYKDTNQTIGNLIGSLLKQLIQFQDDNFSSTGVRKLFHEAGREAAPILSELYEALKSEVSTFKRYRLLHSVLFLKLTLCIQENSRCRCAG